MSPFTFWGLVFLFERRLISAELFFFLFNFPASLDPNNDRVDRENNQQTLVMIVLRSPDLIKTSQ